MNRLGKPAGFERLRSDLDLNSAACGSIEEIGPYASFGNARGQAEFVVSVWHLGDFPDGSTMDSQQIQFGANLVNCVCMSESQESSERGVSN